MKNIKKQNFKWSDEKVIDFVNWYVDVKNLDFRYKLENQTIIDSFKNGDDASIWNKEEGIKNGYIHAPYLIQNSSVCTVCNGEIIWHRNKWKNLLLKIKRFFHKSKNLKNAEKYLYKKVNSSYYQTVKNNNKI